VTAGTFKPFKFMNFKAVNFAYARTLEGVFRAAVHAGEWRERRPGKVTLRTRGLGDVDSLQHLFARLDPPVHRACLLAEQLHRAGL
jgi:hypothetical protein